MQFINILIHINKLYIKRNKFYKYKYLLIIKQILILM